MDSNPSQSTHALDGAVVPTFYRYLLPSLIGMLAMTSASLVDGIFIGNLVGVEALAAVNLLIPILSLLFGVGLMVSVGGSVRGGKYLGEKNHQAASAIFSKTLTFVLGYGALVISAGLLFESQLFRAVGATEALFPLMSEYYRVIMPFLLAQLATIVLYFFIRLDGFPSLTAAALVVGSVVNIALDYLFIARFGWGLTGAAWATAFSQLLPLLVLCGYFFSKKRKLHFSLWQKQWGEVFKAAYNGVSEFINEVSGGIIALIFNWMLIQRVGVEGVAALTVVNYLMMIGFMVFFAIGDTSQVMISQNFGARNPRRIAQFLRIALFNNLFISLICMLALTQYSESLTGLFLDRQSSTGTITLATEFVGYIWPVFIFAGANMLISGYLTALHLAFQSGVVALCRSLILPALLLTVAYLLTDDHRFIAAIPLGEVVTFIIAISYFLRHRPARAIAEMDEPDLQPTEQGADAGNIRASRDKNAEAEIATTAVNQP